VAPRAAKALPGERVDGTPLRERRGVGSEVTGMDGWRRLGGFALRWWWIVAVSAALCVGLAARWATGADAFTEPGRWAVTQVLGGVVLLHVGLLWAPLVAAPADLAASPWRRLGTLPPPVVALIAATLTLVALLALLLVAAGSATLVAAAIG
jgi:hypothetical protein